MEVNKSKNRIVDNLILIDVIICHLYLLYLPQKYERMCDFLITRLKAVIILPFKNLSQVFKTTKSGLKSETRRRVLLQVYFRYFSKKSSIFC